MAEAAIAIRSDTHAAGAARLAAAAVLWGALMAASAAFALLYEQARFPDRRIVLLIAFYFAGGTAGYVAAHILARRVNRRLPVRLHFATALVLLAGGTLAGTAAVLALDYRVYYAQWHASAFSITWFFQQFFTALGSTFQFLVIGTRLYWPLGLVFLLAMSVHLARKSS